MLKNRIGGILMAIEKDKIQGRIQDLQEELVHAKSQLDKVQQAAKIFSDQIIEKAAVIGELKRLLESAGKE